MAKTMLFRIQESKKATNIYLPTESALHLAHRLIRQAEKENGVRVVILDKKDNPGFQVHPYHLPAHPRKKRKKGRR